MVSRAQKCQQFRVIAIVEHRVGNPPLSRELLEPEGIRFGIRKIILFLIAYCRQIWTKDNGLASRGHRIKKIY